jgi:hypothetical protein
MIRGVPGLVARELQDTAVVVVVDIRGLVQMMGNIMEEVEIAAEVEAGVTKRSEAC